MAAIKCPRCSHQFERPAQGAVECPKCGYPKPAKPGAAPAGQTAFTSNTGKPGAKPATFSAQGGPFGAAPSSRPVGPPVSANGPPVPGRLRPIPVGKTIGLGIITLGIYTLVRSFKCSGDLGRTPGGWKNWKLFFWLGFIPYAGTIFTFILYFKNNKHANEMRMQRGLSDSYLPFILLFIPFANIAAPFLWASHYNELAQRT